MKGLFRIAILMVAAAATGCGGSDDAPDARVPTPGGGGPAADAAPATPDAGTATPDSGTSGADAASGTPDAM